MRQTMGRRIDGLDDVERDRLITAPEFNDGRNWWDGECGCLEGTIAAGFPLGSIQQWARLVAREFTSGRPSTFTLREMSRVGWHAMPPAIRYPMAVERFGKDRVVRAIKLRAARGNRVPVNATHQAKPPLSTVRV